jgi:hypothetical protein
VPNLVLVASLWSLAGHPARSEWTLERKLAAIHAAGFDAVSGPPTMKLAQAAAAHGLRRLAAFIAPDFTSAARALDACAEESTAYINIQIGSPELTARAALRLVLRVWQHAERSRLRVSFETHRGTCTETPGKLSALSAGFERATGKIFPVTWDFSHYAVVRQIPVHEWSSYILNHREAITAAGLVHLRPHTAHHIQVPVTHAGKPTAETLRWLPFARDFLALWRTANDTRSRELFVCPELGPRGDYALMSAPPSWPETVRLSRLIRDLWTAPRT